MIDKEKPWGTERQPTNERMRQDNTTDSDAEGFPYYWSYTRSEIPDLSGEHQEVLKHFKQTGEASGCFGFVNDQLYLGRAHHAAIIAALVEAGMTFDELLEAPQMWGWFYGDFTSESLQHGYGDKSISLSFSSDDATQSSGLVNQVKAAFRDTFGKPVTHNPQKSDIKTKPYNVEYGDRARKYLGGALLPGSNEYVSCFGFVNGKLYLGTRHHMAIMRVLTEDMGMTWDELENARQIWGWVSVGPMNHDLWNEEKYQDYDNMGALSYSSDAAIMDKDDEVLVNELIGILDHIWPNTYWRTGGKGGVVGDEYAPRYDTYYGEEGASKNIDKLDVHVYDPATMKWSGLLNFEPTIDSDTLLTNPVNYEFTAFTPYELHAWERLPDDEKQWFGNKAAALRNRATKKGLPATVQAKELFAIWNRYSGRCAYDGQPGADSFDHVVPLGMGGGSTADNLLPAHMNCNEDLGKWDYKRMDHPQVIPDEWKNVSKTADINEPTSFFCFAYIGGDINKLYTDGTSFHYELVENNEELYDYMQSDIPQVWGQINRYTDDEWTIEFWSDWLSEQNYNDETEEYTYDRSKLYEAPEEVQGNALAALQGLFGGRWLIKSSAVGNEISDRYYADHFTAAPFLVVNGEVYVGPYGGTHIGDLKAFEIEGDRTAWGRIWPDGEYECMSGELTPEQEAEVREKVKDVGTQQRMFIRPRAATAVFFDDGLGNAEAYRWVMSDDQIYFGDSEHYWHNDIIARHGITPDWMGYFSPVTKGVMVSGGKAFVETEIDSIKSTVRDAYFHAKESRIASPITPRWVYDPVTGKFAFDGEGFNSHYMLVEDLREGGAIGDMGAENWFGGYLGHSNPEYRYVYPWQSFARKRLEEEYGMTVKKHTRRL